MFGKKFKSINVHLESINDRIGELYRQVVFCKDVIECEKCGCLIKKQARFKGKSEIRQNKSQNVFNSPLNVPSLQNYAALLGSKAEKEHLYTPYYCLRCKPRTAKK